MGNWATWSLQYVTSLKLIKKMSLNIILLDTILVYSKTPSLQGTEGVPCEMSSEPGFHAELKTPAGAPWYKRLYKETSLLGFYSQKMLVGISWLPSPFPLQHISQPHAKQEAANYLASFTDFYEEY